MHLCYYKLKITELHTALNFLFVYLVYRPVLFVEMSQHDRQELIGNVCSLGFAPPQAYTATVSALWVIGAPTAIRHAPA